MFTCVKRHLSANSEPSLEMENEEKIRLEARRRLEEQLKQYRVQRHKERVSEGTPSSISILKITLKCFNNPSHCDKY